MEIEYAQVRPYKRWVLVKADPRVKKTAGGILLTDELVGIERVMEGTGTVLKIGSQVDEVSVGQRVAYRGFLKDVSNGIFKKEDGCDIFFIRVEDLLANIDKGITMGAFSGSSES